MTTLYRTKKYPSTYKVFPVPNVCYLHVQLVTLYQSSKPRRKLSNTLARSRCLSHNSRGIFTRTHKSSFVPIPWETNLNLPYSGTTQGTQRRFLTCLRHRLLLKTSPIHNVHALFGREKGTQYFRPSLDASTRKSRV
ncbi:hypothetical protein L218DRAFT_547329 [Marasmius fiardii PR-910]|nr:hypothetical protein L218DRAFT_547329 [Marasmius fiardii PR-910]